MTWKVLTKPWSHYFKAFYFLSCFLLSQVVVAQHLYPIVDGNYCGLINPSGESKVPTTYHICNYDHAMGLAFVKNEKGWSIKNNMGATISSFYSDTIWKFSNDYIICKHTGGSSLFQLKGAHLKLIEKADSATLFHDAETLYLRLYNNHSSYLFNKEGSYYLKELQVNSFEKISSQHFLVSKDHHFGITDLLGNTYLNIEYDSIQHYYGGLKFYKNSKVGFKKKHFYLNSRKGDHSYTFLTASYDLIETFGEHYLRLKKSDQLILYHIKDQKNVTQNFNHQAIPFTELHHIYKVGNRYGLTDLEGKILSQPTYDKLFDSGHPNVIIYVKDNLFGFLDGKGNELTDNLFDSIAPFKEKGIFPRSFTKYKQNNYFGLVNIKGDTLCGPRYADIHLISDDRAACMRTDSSARIFLLNKRNAELEDYYDILHIKQLDISKYLIHTGTDALTTKIGPHDNRYFAHKIYNYDNVLRQNFQYNLADYSKVVLKKVKNNHLFFCYHLNENSFAPTDESITLLSVDHSHRSGYRFYNPVIYANETYQSTQLIDHTFIKAVDFNNKVTYLNLDLSPFLLTGYEGKTKKSMLVSDHFTGSKSFPNVFKVTAFAGEANYLVPHNNYQEQHIPIGYDSLKINDTIIIGRKNNYWQIANYDSLKLPEKAVDISFNDSLYLTTQKHRSYYIYDKYGNETLHFDSITVIDESVDGLILIEKDSLFNFINPAGKLILNEWVEDVQPFKNGFSSVRNQNMFNTINTNGVVIISNQSKPLFFNAAGVAVYYHEKNYGLIDSTGEIIDSAHYYFLKTIENTNLFMFKNNRQDELGIISSTGLKLQINEFKKVSHLADNLILITSKKGVGILNATTGKIVSKPSYSSIKYAGEGFLLVKKKTKWGLYNQFGAKILPLKYYAISYFRSNGYAMAKGKKNTFYVLTDGTITQDKPADPPKPECDIQPLILNYLGEYCGIEKLKIPAQFHKITPFRNGCYLAERNHRYLITNLNGKVLLESDSWLAANIVDNYIMKVQLENSVKYYNLRTKTWVY